ncbi:MAG TPA: hypothetical protein DET40_06355 [Lentisphaeria bacterium]|nr:MAG: hypothetical protein A2X45_17775 [Lentisphaerae bacterium GWF2_50_93]HCE43149.1 hypothetical protein [Lentisphaeria bacterium]
MISKSILLFLLFPLLSSSAALSAFAADNPNPQDIWNQAAFSKNVKLQGGSLLLSPGDKPWGSATATGKNSIFFWNGEGVNITMTLSFDSTYPESDDKYDAVAFVGLTTAGKAGSIQSAENVVGISIEWNRKKGTFEALLGRKEAFGEKQEARGDQWGNVPWATAPVSIPAKSGKLIVSLRLDEKAFNAEIRDAGFSQSIPSTELSRKLWDRPSFLIAQCRNSALGRGNMSISDVSLEYHRPDPGKFKCLDLRPFANMGFKDEVDGDRQGGWTDQGNNDMRNIPAGNQMIQDIPFDIIVPESNSGKSSVMLYSNKKDFFPRELGPVPVGMKANSIIILHSAAWAGKEGVEAYRCRVTFEDGKEADIPFVTGKHIQDWWSLQEVTAPEAVLLLKVKSENSARGLVGIYAYLWDNPNPENPVRSLSFISAGNDPIPGIVAVTAVAVGIGEIDRKIILSAFEKGADGDFRKSPPDKEQIPARIVVKQEKTFGRDSFSAAGNYTGGRGGIESMSLPGFAPEVNSIGGILRYPHGFEGSFLFWPYGIGDWYQALGDKGGSYGAIIKWIYKGKDKPAPQVIRLQEMLEACRKNGNRMIIQLNCVSMFDGKDFLYMKTLPEERMKRENPLDSGKFSQENLDKIVANNATMLDYVISNGYKDTVAAWEMDNERWDMPGADYAATVAAHVKMIRSKIPDAKTIVCLAGIDAYCANLDGSRYIIWNKELLSTLAKLGMQSKIDYFAPHEYPFLHDNAEEITQNYLEDWCIRNLYRDLDVASSMLDTYGFKDSKLYISEWGVQSDRLGDESRNDLITSMAAGLAAAKTIMAIYSHPRVEGGTLHPYMHASFVSKEKEIRFMKWGCQTLFFTSDGRFISTPHLEAVKMFVKFSNGSTFVTTAMTLPDGIQCLGATDKDGKKYFAVNSTGKPFAFPVKDISKRTSLFSKSVTDTAVVKYGSYCEKPEDLRKIHPVDFTDNILPPYSISILR